MTAIPNKPLTLCMIYDDEKILLGMKKRGFGAGRWNGFGGKLGKDESIKDAALRELHEEVGIVPEDLRHRGFIIFEFQGDPQKLEVHLYSAHQFSGEPSESEEMKPQWFTHQDIPYDSMWPDDKYWIPIILEGKNVEGYFLFGKDDEVLKKELKTTS